MLTATQVQKRLGISRETFRKLVNTGQLRAFKVGPEVSGHWRVSEEALAEFIERQTVKPAGVAS
jgi:excisionase family DNA binding protein